MIQKTHALSLHVEDVDSWHYGKYKQFYSCAHGTNENSFRNEYKLDNFKCGYSPTDFYRALLNPIWNVAFPEKKVTPIDFS